MSILEAVAASGPHGPLPLAHKEAEILVETTCLGQLTESSESSQDTDQDAVCIVGMACHLPGGVSSPSDLWDLLYNKQSAQCSVPAERFNIDGFYHPDGNRSGSINVSGGYFLKENVRQFDNAFFGINNLEARHMDPQQQKLLEVVYECFENAGLYMEDVSETNTGVFVGNFTVDHAAMQSKETDYVHRYAATGGGTSIMSNRISHIFNLHGPSMTLDTACSSTIYALHQAVLAINNGDCDGAIVAGVNLIMSPEQHIGTMKGGFLSPTSACHTFDASADGYARAEAINAIYIKRLSSAVSMGQKARAVIRGTAINANGRTPGITLPNATHQAAVIRKAYANAGLDPAETDYVECHGTGTPVGDPIEVDGIAQCFSPRPGKPLMIGSVKTNLGHSEAASGLTSIMKVALAFEHGLIPPTYGVKNLNPKLKLAARNMQVLNEPEEWPRAMRRASVNSFGYGGANGHVILESVDSYLNRSPSTMSEPLSAKARDAPEESLFVMPFSAASSWSLSRRRMQISHLVQSSGNDLMRDLAMTCATRDSKLQLRDFIVANTGAKPAILEGGGEADAVPQSARALPLAFVFTGQGAQYAGMAKELFKQNPIFLASIRQLDQVLQSLPKEHAPSWTIEKVLLGSSASQINLATHSQPLCTAIQVALVDVLRDWGISPSAVVGHSSGEIAASYAAGLLTASQAILAAYFRGLAVGQLQARGTMMAAGISAEDARGMIQEKGLMQIRVGCINSPSSITLSGSASDIQTLEDELQRIGKFHRKLETGGRAYHSQMMVEIGELYERLISPYLEERCDADKVPFFSSVGILPEEIQNVDGNTDMAAYFRRNLELPVQFNDALQRIITIQSYHVVEVGPHAALKGPIQQIRSSLKLGQDVIPYTPTLVRKEDANRALKKMAGTLHVHGHSVNWLCVNNLPMTCSTSLLDLPPYPWDYSKPTLWHEPRASVETRSRKYLRHELLGTRKLVENGIDWNWRNIFRVSEMPWLKDHKLESTIVLPGSAYVALAIEAISQIESLKERLENGDSASFECRSISISAPLSIQEEGDAERKDTELHTTMSRRKLSNVNSSAYWYDFSVSSWQDGKTSLHCTGSIRTLDSPSMMPGQGGTLVTDTQGFELWSMDRWYKKCREEGLDFGPHFKSLTGLHTDAGRVRVDSIATTQRQPPCTKDGGTFYAIHPITLDACFQAAIMGGTAGELSTLRAFVPTFIEECVIRVPRRLSPDQPSKDCSIHSRVGKTGFGTRNVDCTLRQPDGTPVVNIRGLHLSLYTGKAPVQPILNQFLKRQPTLRVLWKPDILRLRPGAQAQLQAYINAFADLQPADMHDNPSSVVLGALLDLAGHKNPRMRVLELGAGCDCTEKTFLKMLYKDTAYPRCQSWHGGNLDENNEISFINKVEGKKPFDVVVISRHSTSKRFWTRVPEKVTSLLAEQGLVITRTSDGAVSSLASAGFRVVELQHNVLLAIPAQRPKPIHGKTSLIIKPNESSTIIDGFAALLRTHLESHADVEKVVIASLHDLDNIEVSEETVCVSLLELEQELLATLKPEDMNRLRKMTNFVTSLIWLTGADILGSPNPDLTLSCGLSRALMLEQPSLRFALLDCGEADLARPQDALTTCENVVEVAVSRAAVDDTEFIEKEKMLFISRFVPDMEVNSLFRQRMEVSEQMEMVPFGKLGPASLSIGQIGMIDTMHFQQISQPSTRPPAGHVDVDLRAVSLNAKDIYVMNGRVETRNATTALDFGGVVSAVGPDVTHIQPGDRVVAFAPNHFKTTERVPVGSVHKMLPTERFTTLPALMTIYATALHALRDRANVRPGEAVLIHAGAGAFGFAAITMARSMGAVVYTTCGSSAKREFLISDVGVPADHIFNSRDSSFVEDIKAATGNGVDVIINSLVGDLMHESWGCLAPFGRFIEIGKRELVDAGKLDMSVFLRGASFSAFDLTDYFYAENPLHRNVWDSLADEVVKLYRSGKIQPPPITSFDVSNMEQAYHYFNNKDRVGKVVVSMENPESRVPMMPAKYSTVLDPDKSYLLVGCLGGLGRSLSRWMMARGARKFVFMGRSGCDKPAAAQLVANLRNANAQVSVVRGDVADAIHVREAVSACLALGPIGGVVQAAMGLKEALFTSMSNEAWHTGIQPKWKGTWNLHNELVGHDAQLDFFLMTSSISGSLGTATESNYCSANGFLDSFARWRRSQGKPGVSLGLGMISEVGYLHENPEIEAMLLRKGIQPLGEDELLQVVDYGLSGPGSEADFLSGSSLPGEAAHLLTGLEPLSVRKLMSRGFDVSGGVMDETRASLLAASLMAESEARQLSQKPDAANLAMVSGWARDLPADAVAMFATETDADSMMQAVLGLVKKRFSNLILSDQVDENKPLPSFGVDSMLAAEFRRWFFNVFKVDVPYLDIVSPQKTLLTLSGFVHDKLKSNWALGP